MGGRIRRTAVETREVGHRATDLGGGSHPEEDRDSVGLQPAGHECKRLERFSIDPLGVIDDAQKSALGGTVRKQGQGGKTDEEWIRNGMAGQSKCGIQSVSLRLGRLLTRSSEGWRRRCSPAKLR